MNRYWARRNFVWRGVRRARCTRGSDCADGNVSAGHAVHIPNDRRARTYAERRSEGLALAERERRYAAVTFALDDGRALHYRDIRRLGTVALMDPVSFDAYTGTLGVEPLDPAFTAAHLASVLGRSRRPVKTVLMDQRRLAGVGNIYANEALWRSGIDPSREARAVGLLPTTHLRDALVAVLGESIAARGTSFRDYRDASGGRGACPSRVHGRAPVWSGGAAPPARR